MKKDTGKPRPGRTTRPAAKRAASRTPPDEILPEYDFSHAVRNKYAARYAATVAEGACLVTLDPDVAAVFPDSSSVNEALRAIAGIIRQHARGASRQKKR